MMRGGRSFLVLVVLALGLGAYVYFVESRRPADAGDKKEKVFTVDAAKIDEITVKAESGDRTTLRKDGNDWKMVAPLETKPDASQISGITTTLAALEVQRVIEDNPPSLAEYGLETPRVDITFKAEGKEHHLLIGRKTPPATDLYAKLADSPRVFLISSYLDSSLNRGTFDLRDKTALAVNRDEVDAVTITRPASNLRFAKSGSEWRIVEPVQARADFGVVDSLVGRIAALQMTSIAAPDGGKPADFGLQPPAATIAVGNQSSHATLTLGKSSGEGAVYARDESRPLVFTVDSSLLDELKKDADTFRQKDLFDARGFNTTQFQVVHAGQTFAFEKAVVKNKDGQDQDAWRQTSPQAKDADADKVADLLSKITTLRADGFAAAAPAGATDAPELVVTLTSDNGNHKETARIGRRGTEGWAARDGEPGAMKIPASAIDDIVKALGEIK